MGACCSAPPPEPPNPERIDLSHFDLLKVVSLVTRGSLLFMFFLLCLLWKVVGKGGFGKVNAVQKRAGQPYAGEYFALKRMAKHRLVGRVRAFGFPFLLTLFLHHVSSDFSFFFCWFCLACVYRFSPLLCRLCGLNGKYWRLANLPSYCTWFVFVVSPASTAHLLLRFSCVSCLSVLLLAVLSLILSVILRIMLFKPTLNYFSWCHSCEVVTYDIFCPQMSKWVSQWLSFTWQSCY